MDDDASIPAPILASVPDGDVPAERVDTASSKSRRKRRASLFLKGPISFGWIREYIQSPTDRLLLVLRAHGDMRHSNEVSGAAAVVRDAGIDLP